MSWIDLVDNNYFLRMLYPSGDPSLDAIQMHEIVLHQDGPTVSLRFNLNEYPATPPAKWRSAQANTVQLRIAGTGVRQLVLTGWSTTNIGQLTIMKASGVVVVEFDGGDSRLNASFDFLSVESVDAYHHDLRGGV
jgi:hypothetical protein